jgi:hypothetical protein
VGLDCASLPLYCCLLYVVCTNMSCAARSTEHGVQYVQYHVQHDLVSPRSQGGRGEGRNPTGNGDGEMGMGKRGREWGSSVEECRNVLNILYQYTMNMNILYCMCEYMNMYVILCLSQEIRVEGISCSDLAPFHHIHHIQSIPPTLTSPHSPHLTSLNPGRGCGVHLFAKNHVRRRVHLHSFAVTSPGEMK